MQGYYVAGMYVSGDHLCHANVDVAGFWRNLKKGGRVWVNSFRRNIKGLGQGASYLGQIAKKSYNIGANKSYKPMPINPSKGKSIGSKVGLTLASGASNVGYTAGRAAKSAKNMAKQAKWIAGVNKTNAKIGYNAGKYGWDRKKLVGNSVVGNAAYAVGRASKHVGDAANAVKEWGGKAIEKAKTFITNLFSKIGNGAKAIPGLVNKAVTTLKTEAPKAIEKGKSFMSEVFKSVNSARKGFQTGIKGTYAKYYTDAESTGYNAGRALNRAGKAIKNAPGNIAKTARTTADNISTSVGNAVRPVREKINRAGDVYRMGRSGTAAIYGTEAEQNLYNLGRRMSGKKAIAIPKKKKK